MKTIGVISDTHGLLRPEALAALAGCDAILHAGDIGSPLLLESLQHIAPVHAVRGNVDRELWAAELPWTQWIEVEGVAICVLHDLNELDFDPRAAGVQIVVSGHSHQPRVAEMDGVLYVNPGSAGPRRLHHPVTLAKLCVGAGPPAAEIVLLLPE